MCVASTANGFCCFERSFAVFAEFSDDAECVFSLGGVDVSGQVGESGAVFGRRL